MSDVARAFGIGMIQIESEISALYDFVRKIEPGNIMEIGSKEGGTFYLWCRLATGKKISLDLPGGPFGTVSMERGEILTRSVSEEVGCGPRLRFGLVGEPTAWGISPRPLTPEPRPAVRSGIPGTPDWVPGDNGSVLSSF